MNSAAERLLEVQLQGAGIEFDREVAFYPGRRFRADFHVGLGLLVEVEGGVWVSGRHVRGSGFESGCEKQALALLRGFRYLRVTSAQVEDGRALEWIKGIIELEAVENMPPDEQAAGIRRWAGGTA